MPFMAKCRICGYIVFANSRRFLEMFMEQHDSESHKVYDSRDFDFNSWVVVRLTWGVYTQLCIASKNPAFWRAIRTKATSL